MWRYNAAMLGKVAAGKMSYVGQHVILSYKQKTHSLRCRKILKNLREQGKWKSLAMVAYVTHHNEASKGD